MHDVQCENDLSSTRMRAHERERERGKGEKMVKKPMMTSKESNQRDRPYPKLKHLLNESKKRRESVPVISYERERESAYLRCWRDILAYVLFL